MDGLKSILDINEERHNELKEVRGEYLNFKWRGKKKWEEREKWNETKERMYYLNLHLTGVPERGNR